MAEPKPHILVVDDDDRLRALITRFLKENGFAVSTARGGGEARELLTLFTFDLMVLDVMMPDETGLALAKSVKNLPPILMLSALGGADDRVAGLEVGADDYLAKPFEPRELVLRIRSILRRSSPATGAAQKVTFGAYVFDRANAQLTCDGEIVHLTAAETTLLTLLASAMGKPVSREVLARGVGLETGAERGVDVQITRLRKKLEPEGRPHYIQTVRGEGYQLHAVGMGA
jgi:two-component system phosphate regulon response regulator OmpR